MHASQCIVDRGRPLRPLSQHPAVGGCRLCDVVSGRTKGCMPAKSSQHSSWLGSYVLDPQQNTAASLASAAVQTRKITAHKLKFDKTYKLVDLLIKLLTYRQPLFLLLLISEIVPWKATTLNVPRLPKRREWCWPPGERDRLNTASECIRIRIQEPWIRMLDTIITGI